jgi:hypothetical protein
MNRLVGSGFVLTALTSFGLYGPEQSDDLILSSVNEDESLLSHWESEEYNSLSPPGCEFYNFTKIYTSDLCTHFVTSRSSSTPSLAFERAEKCAGLFAVECILSPEIGLAVPAAFLVPPSGPTQMILAPRIVSVGSQTQQQHVRVHEPSSSGTKTRMFNPVIDVEYIDGKTRALRTETFRGSDAYCVQLLRLAFVPTCWKNLD